MPTETNIRGDALLHGHGTFSSSKVGGWRLVAVGGGWWLVGLSGWRFVAVGSSWRLAVGGGWRFEVVGGWSLGAILKGCP